MTEAEKRDVADELKRDLRRVVFAVVAVAIVLALGFVWGYLDSQAQRNDLRRDARNIAAEQKRTAERERRTAARERRTTMAFCAIRGNVESSVASDKTRVAQGRAFLRAHPGGIPGISRRLLIDSVKQQEQDLADEEATLGALKPLRCPEPTRKPPR